MASLFSLLAGKISKPNHKRLEEILHVLDGSVNYKIKYTRSLSAFKHSLETGMSDHDGYEVIDSWVVTYNGSVCVYPRKKINGDFVFTVAKSRLFNPVSKNSFTEHIILIYEQGLNVKEKFKGVI
jgi:hypothetical protein